jgi:hypothetical protein
MFDQPRLVTDQISKAELCILAAERFGDLVKAVVDIRRDIIAVGGELHADEEALLLDDGSNQQDLWGINLYPDNPDDEFVEFDSMINLRPAQGNRSRGVDNPEIQAEVLRVVALRVKE